MATIGLSENHGAETAVNFSQQAELWLRELASRKRRPVAPSTLRVFGSYVRRLTPMIGELKLAEINNGVLRELVQKLDGGEQLSAKTITELVAVVKQVVGSLVDQETGEPTLKREWSASFIDCPTITKQKQPCLTTKDVERCLRESTSNQERVLYAVLAGSGLRIAETLAIHVGGKPNQTWWSPERAVVDVRSSIFNGREIPRLKTKAAARTVDLDPQLNALITKFVEITKVEPGDYLFQARSGRPMHLKTARERLAKHGIPGFHGFRRFFISRRRSIGFPEFLLRSIVGHSGKSITDLYDKSAEDEAFRKYWAEKAGLGFELPELRPADPARTNTLFPDLAAQPEEVVRYQATDDDLPTELLEAAEAR